MVDLYIALGLVVIVIIVYLLSRMKLLPKKSLLFVIGGLLGVLGLGLFNRLRRDSLVKELEKREKALKEREKKLEELKNRSEISEQKLNEMKAEFERQRAAYEKEILSLKAKSKEEKEKIDKLSGDELHDAFWDATG
ncbi:MAG: hypothetical protein GTO45_39390 [Candidatus Aminicenantes bacterium]|nr:hypothetical protein [Candidatus Aminicenantes bacterium]NIM84693.1 hypothetical protein [Candidatus Aminicenantes bacterium]NIN24192.1 hypothetical protein [Candidatus Aminicenantes bacterium]NIN47917.1 hypothetical protein [Candidatus Aminicenantes bacterium]NIN90855.1 hypothetical protein [Candidatus Aminicenantes bacterium]